MRRHALHRWAAALGLAAAALAPLGGCTTNPATGEKYWNTLSREQEISIGEEQSPELIRQYDGLIPDQHVRDYVAEIGHRLAALSEYADLPWEFHALNSEVINAFALPGGKVFITRGLMSKMTNEAQLAGVLGHEIGHVTAQHMDQRYRDAIIAGVIATGVGIATRDAESDAVRYGAPAGTAVATMLVTRKFSRNQESQADLLGLRYMTRAGYDPQALLGVMTILGEAGGGGGIEWLQTHPLPATRYDDIRQLIDEQYAHTRNNPAYELHADRFEASVLDRLDDLPAPDGTQQLPRGSAMRGCCP